MDKDKLTEKKIMRLQDQLEEEYIAEIIKRRKEDFNLKDALTEEEIMGK